MDSIDKINTLLKLQGTDFEGEYVGTVIDGAGFVWHAVVSE